MSFYDLTVMNADNEAVSMKDFEGKVVLVVNTARSIRIWKRSTKSTTNRVWRL